VNTGQAGWQQELADWLRLEQTAGVGPATARQLLNAFGLPANIFASSRAELSRVVPERVAQALLAAPPESTLKLIDSTAQWLSQPGNHVLSWADADYPPALLTIADPPILLYAKGRLDLFNLPALAMVGSRHASSQGLADARRFACAISEVGLPIISGLAQGIDAAAHQGGLQGPGSTIAVIGTGVDIVYPARNRKLAHQIAEQGCLLSEYALGMPAISSNFPRRNRIISGLARAVLVVEAAAQSGSLITARMALEQGRDVFAIPGSIHSTLSKGCHQLIKQGAKLVESAQDVLEELRDYNPQRPVPVQAPLALTGQPLSIIQALGFDPVDVDSLVLRTGLDAASLTEQLLTLELDGLLERLPGGWYRRLVA
jgi:DNA processing protein